MTYTTTYEANELFDMVTQIADDPLLALFAGRTRSCCTALNKAKAGVTWRSGQAGDIAQLSPNLSDQS
jgi:hypothetical protein